MQVTFFQTVGKAFLLFALLGVNSIFILQHYVGIEGHPRRIFSSPEIFVGLASFSNVGIFSVLLFVAVFPYAFGFELKESF